MRTEAQEIKEIAKVSKFIIPFTLLLCLSRQCMKKRGQRAMERPGLFHILLPLASPSLDDWIIQ